MAANLFEVVDVTLKERDIADGRKILYKNLIDLVNKATAM